MNQQAIEAATRSVMESLECGHPMTKGHPVCDMHGEPCVDLDMVEVYGFSGMSGLCPVAKDMATNALEAALPSLEADIRSQISEAIRCEVEQGCDLGEWDEYFSSGMVYAADIVEGN